MASQPSKHGNSNLGTGGHHWRQQEHVDRWADVQRAIAPQRRIAFDALLARLPADLSIPLRIIDLGAGDGTVASVVLDKYPQSHAVLIDFSEEMILNGADQLQRFTGRYRYLRWDMNQGQWPHELDGPYDAVVSSAAIHHLTNERKSWLARCVHSHLTEGGIFANFDLFRLPDATFGEDEAHDRTCATLQEAKQSLTSAGFADVQVDAHSARPGRKTESALLIGVS